VEFFYEFAKMYDRNCFGSYGVFLPEYDESRGFSEGVYVVKWDRVNALAFRRTLQYNVWYEI
jgi:hypothetical protein